MRADKKFISQEYVLRLNSSPFFIVVDYTGLTVLQFTELRKRLHVQSVSHGAVVFLDEGHS